MNKAVHHVSSPPSRRKRHHRPSGSKRLWKAIFPATTFKPIYAAVALCFVLLGLFRPLVLAPLNRVWTRLGLLLGKIVAPLTLGGLFFLVITPVAVILRWMGKDILHLRRNPIAVSYWILRDPPGPTPESIRDQF